MVTTPEQQENELICEKLLGWERWHRPDIAATFWRVTSADIRSTPTFTTWADAGLILDTAHRKNLRVRVLCNGSTIHWWCYSFDNPHGMSLGSTGPLAIRAAALVYVKRLQS